MGANPLDFNNRISSGTTTCAFWIIPDFVYCALSFAISEKVLDYGIGVVGFFTTAHYSRDAALIDRLLTFALLLIMQYAVKLLIKLIKKVGGKSKS